MTCFIHPDCVLEKGHSSWCADTEGKPCLTGNVFKYAPEGVAFDGHPPIKIQRRPKTTIGKLWATYRDIRAARKRRIPFHF